MNQREQLVETTIKLIESQLSESISWEKDIHDKNYEYKTFDNGKYGRVDYEDTIYDYGTFKINNQAFSVTHMISDPKNKEFNDTYNISSTHPYDNSKYHYAKALGNSLIYKIYRDGKYVDSIIVSDLGDDNEIIKVAERLYELDKNIESRMSHY